MNPRRTCTCHRCLLPVRLRAVSHGFLARKVLHVFSVCRSTRRDVKMINDEKYGTRNTNRKKRKEYVRHAYLRVRVTTTQSRRFTWFHTREGRHDIAPLRAYLRAIAETYIFFLNTRDKVHSPKLSDQARFKHVALASQEQPRMRSKRARPPDSAAIDLAGTSASCVCN